MSSFYQNAKKPEGVAGKLMIKGMNQGHADLARWGFVFLDLKEDDYVLDIGCGGGANVAYLCSQCTKGHVTGIDYSNVSVEVSEKFNQKEIDAGRCTILQGDVGALPFKEHTFDCITAEETVYFWPKIEEAFTSIHTTLKEHGVFMILNAADGVIEDGASWKERIDGMEIYTAQELQTMLEKAGFSKIISHGHPKGWLCMLAYY